MPRRPRPRIVLAVLLCVVLAGAGAGVGVAVSGDDGGAPSVPEGGSGFRTDRGRPFSDGLARLLALAEPGGGVRVSGSETRTRGEGPAVDGSEVAQLLLVELDTPADDALLASLRDRDWGGVLLAAGSIQTEPQVQALTAGLRAAGSAGGGPAPLIAGVNGLPPTPQPQARGAAGARDQAHEAALKLNALGVDLTFAPVADLADPGGPADGVGYGSDPVAVAHQVRAAVDAYRAAGVATAVGHFPGQGAATQDPHAGTASVGLPLAQLEARDMAPFALIASRTPVVMMSDALFAAIGDGVTPAALSREAVDLLRERIGFHGVVLADDLGAASQASGGSLGDAAVAALQAGCDMLLVPGGPQQADAVYGAVLAAVRRGELASGRVASAAARVAELKRRWGAQPAT